MTVALIVAAGSGERLGAGRPKALVELAGRPLVAWSIDALLATAGIERIVLAMPPGAELPPALGAVDGVTVVDGGASRSDSVRRALDAAGPPRRGWEGGEPGESDFVLVHDAARPLVTPALAESVIAALARDRDADAAIAALPVTDTVKRVDSHGAVHETLERSELWAVQTPQVFRRAALERALDVHPDELARATDDAGLIERGGGRVIVVRASDENLKVTTPLDLRVAELLLAGRSAESAGPRKPS
ncbi:MAG: 2-C-methyl-D-erythritol 4-phosphate cytidylyltransferase [Solirubrobacteraceae bacterium]